MTLKEYLNKDLYEILGITYDADVAKIKAAYRKMARIHHPDVNNNTPESIVKFKEITETYEFLLDKEKRRNYDDLKGFTRKRVEDSAAQRAQAKKAYSYTAEQNKKAETPRKEKAEKDEHKESFSNIFNTILDGLFPHDETGYKEKKENKKKLKPKDGRDINLNVTIKISEAVNGTHRTINVLHTEVCPKCEGRKFINGVNCPMCKGTGEISIHKKLSVKIPAHIKKGAKIRIANEGNKGCNGGKDGDLYLYIDIEESGFFKYDNLNVTCEIPITSYEAALGAEIEVPTLNKPVNMKIPAGTTSGQKFRLTGEGLKDEETGKYGDQIVTVIIEMPKDLSEEEIELYNKLKNISRHTVRENLDNA